MAFEVYKWRICRAFKFMPSSWSLRYK